MQIRILAKVWEDGAIRWFITNEFACFKHTHINDAPAKHTKDEIVYGIYILLLTQIHAYDLLWNNFKNMTNIVKLHAVI